MERQTLYKEHMKIQRELQSRSEPKHIALSILIPTVPRRYNNVFLDITDKLLRQADNKPVEIIGLFDNRKRCIGAKRNILLDSVQGDYFAFVDDDDDVADNYVDAILSRLRFDPDLIVFWSHYKGYTTKREYIQKYGINFEKRFADGFYYAPPCHVHVWRTALVKDIKFPVSQYGEDVDWLERATKLVDASKVQSIEQALYVYQDDWNRSESRRPIWMK
jgi:hypothetical protein